MGAEVWLGCLPTHRSLSLTADEVRGRVLRFLDTLGVTEALAGHLVLTPACGLAGFTAAEVSHAFALLATVSRQVSEELDGNG